MRGVHTSKLFRIELEGTDPTKAVAAVEEMCRKLLANPVIHDYRVEVER